MSRRLVILGACLACLFGQRWPCLARETGQHRGPASPAVTHVTSIKCLDPDTGTRFTPLGVAFDLSGRLCVVDSDDSRLFTVSDFAAGPVLLGDCPEDSNRCQPVDVLADAGLFYVSDRTGGRIAVLSSEGKLLSQCETGPGVGGLGLARAGQVYAAMTVTGAVVIADVLGEKSLVTCPISDAGGSAYPLDCLVLASGRVLVTDASAGEVLILNLLGKRLGTLEGFEFKSPFGISRYLDSTVLVSDSDLGVVAAFDSSGRFLRDFGKGYLKTPTFLDARDDGTLCVADAGKMTIEVFKIDGSAEK